MGVCDMVEPARSLMLLPLKSMGVWSKDLVQEDTQIIQLSVLSVVVDRFTQMKVTLAASQECRASVYVCLQIE